MDRRRWYVQPAIFQLTFSGFLSAFFPFVSVFVSTSFFSSVIVVVIVFILLFLTERWACKRENEDYIPFQNRRICRLFSFTCSKFTRSLFPHRWPEEVGTYFQGFVAMCLRGNALSMTRCLGSVKWALEKDPWFDVYENIFRSTIITLNVLGTPHTAVA